MTEIERRWSDRDLAALQRREIEWLRRFWRRYLSLRFTLNGTVLACPIPDPYQNRTGIFFFFGQKWVRLGYACSGTRAVYVPTKYPVPVRRPFCRTGASYDLYTVHFQKLTYCHVNLFSRKVRQQRFSYTSVSTFNTVCVV